MKDYGKDLNANYQTVYEIMGYVFGNAGLILLPNILK